jgi:hypothetical protein
MASSELNVIASQTLKSDELFIVAKKDLDRINRKLECLDKCLASNLERIDALEKSGHFLCYEE